MSTHPFVVAVAVRPRLLRETLLRVLAGHCVVVVVDAEAPAAETYDLVVTDRPEGIRVEADAVIDLSGDEAVLQLPDSTQGARLGTIADLIRYIEAEQARRSAEQ